MALPERLLLLGGVRQQPVLQAAGVPVGVVTGVMLCWGAAGSPPSDWLTAAPS